MNQKIVAAFLLVTLSTVLAHPGIARDDAVVAPVVVAQEVAAAVPLSASSEAPEVSSSVAPVPEEQPTQPAALLDDATAQPVTLPAIQEVSVPVANDNVAVPVAVPVL